MRQTGLPGNRRHGPQARHANAPQVRQSGGCEGRQHKVKMQRGQRRAAHQGARLPRQMLDGERRLPVLQTELGCQRTATRRAERWVVRRQRQTQGDKLRRDIGVRSQHGKTTEGGIREKLKVVDGVQGLVSGLAGHLIVAIIMIAVVAVAQVSVLMLTGILVKLADMRHLMCQANAAPRPCATIRHEHDEQKKSEVMGE